MWCVPLGLTVSQIPSFFLLLLLLLLLILLPVYSCAIFAPAPNPNSNLTQELPILVKAVLGVGSLRLLQRSQLLIKRVGTAASLGTVDTILTDKSKHRLHAPWRFAFASFKWELLRGGGYSVVCSLLLWLSCVSWHPHHQRPHTRVHPGGWTRQGRAAGAGG